MKTQPKLKPNPGKMYLVLEENSNHGGQYAFIHQGFNFYHPHQLLTYTSFRGIASKVQQHIPYQTVRTLAEALKDYEEN